MAPKVRWGVSNSFRGSQDRWGGVRLGKGQAGRGREKCAISIEKKSSFQSTTENYLDMYELYVGL